MLQVNQQVSHKNGQIYIPYASVKFPTYHDRFLIHRIYAEIARRADPPEIVVTLI